MAVVANRPTVRESLLLAEPFICCEASTLYEKSVLSNRKLYHLKFQNACGVKKCGNLYLGNHS